MECRLDGLIKMEGAFDKEPHDRVNAMIDSISKQIKENNVVDEDLLSLAGLSYVLIN